MKGRSFAKNVLTFGAILLTAVSVQGSSITWGPPTNITGDTDVSTAGSLVAAFNFGYSPTTVNGVLFPTFLTGPPDPFYTTLANGNFVLTAGFNPEREQNGAFVFGPPWYFGSGTLEGTNFEGAFAALSPSYQDLLGEAISAQSPFTLTINGLSIGSTYEFQWWTNSCRTGQQIVSATSGNTVTLDPNTAHMALLGVGQFAIGTFTADASSQTIQFGPDDFLNNGFPVLNALQLRDLGAQAVPEPRSVVMLGLGLVVAMCAYGKR